MAAQLAAVVAERLAAARGEHAGPHGVRNGRESCALAVGHALRGHSVREFEVGGRPRVLRAQVHGTVARPPAEVLAILRRRDALVGAIRRTIAAARVITAAATNRRKDQERYLRRYSNASRRDICTLHGWSASRVSRPEWVLVNVERVALIMMPSRCQLETSTLSGRAGRRRRR